MHVPVGICTIQSNCTPQNTAKTVHRIDYGQLLHPSNISRSPIAAHTTSAHTQSIALHKNQTDQNSNLHLKFENRDLCLINTSVTDILPGIEG